MSLVGKFPLPLAEAHPRGPIHFSPSGLEQRLQSDRAEDGSLDGEDAGRTREDDERRGRRAIAGGRRVGGRCGVGHGRQAGRSRGSTAVRPCRVTGRTIFHQWGGAGRQGAPGRRGRAAVAAWPTLCSLRWRALVGHGRLTWRWRCGTRTGDGCGEAVGEAPARAERAEGGGARAPWAPPPPACA